MLCIDTMHNENSMIKIIFLSPVSCFKGGAERSLFDLMGNPSITPVLVVPAAGELADKARELGIAVEIINFGGISSIRRPFKFADGFAVLKDLYSAAKELKQVAARHGARVVHSNGLKAHFINCACKILCKTKAVLHIRDIAYTKPERYVWHILQKLCDRFIIVSKACWPGETLPKNVHVIYNGTPLIDPVAKEAVQTGAPLNLGFIGRIHPGKGLHLLIDWAAAARKQGMDIALSVRGTFSEDAPAYEGEIHAQIKQLCLEEYVTFTGFIDNAVTLYKGIDITVVPSHMPDPLPRSVMESMARGIPVIGYPAGGIGEMIIQGKTGFLARDTHTFLQAIQSVLDDPAQIDRLTQNARTRIRDEFSIERLHQKMMKVYTSI